MQQNNQLCTIKLCELVFIRLLSNGKANRSLLKFVGIPERRNINKNDKANRSLFKFVEMSSMFMVGVRVA